MPHKGLMFEEKTMITVASTGIYPIFISKKE